MERPGQSRDSRGMTRTSALTRAAMAAIALPETAPGGAEVPEWVQLIPAGQAIRTHDGRGPYRLEDAEAVVRASMEDARIAGDLPVDVNHATDLLAPKGHDAPARGWIRELAARADGIWGRVDWTPEGRALVAGQAYRGISPVFLHDAAGRIARILRASLTNIPNLRGLAALNQETRMDLRARLADKLGLGGEADDDALLAAIPAKTDTALQAQIAEIGAALGVEGGDARQILVAAKLKAGASEGAAVLQAENDALKGRVDAIEAAARKTAAVAFVDKALAERRVGVNAGNRDELVAMHMESPAMVEKLIGQAPTAGATHTGIVPPATTALQAEVPDLVGRARAYQDKERAAGRDIDWGSAVMAVSEGRK